MAFRLGLRRSKKVGPFRLSLTKRGVGASVGVPGARYSMHSTGRRTKTLGVPGTGIFWRETRTSTAGRPCDTQTAAAPGWLPDPTRGHQWRWWSGTRWTPHVADDGMRSYDPK